MKISDLEHLEVISEATTIEGGAIIISLTGLANATTVTTFPIGNLVSTTTFSAIGGVSPNGTISGVVNSTSGSSYST